MLLWARAPKQKFQMRGNARPSPILQLAEHAFRDVSVLIGGAIEREWRAPFYRLGSDTAHASACLASTIACANRWSGAGPSASLRLSPSDRRSVNAPRPSTPRSGASALASEGMKVAR